ncbi:hypothetical protein B0H13DRAFT_1891665 [Mycena leptocephala]|nr:hypothetical protein B0H13DRAFT_1891665 [Mycena leptocephala]
MHSHCVPEVKSILFDTLQSHRAKTFNDTKKSSPVLALSEAHDRLSEWTCSVRGNVACSRHPAASCDPNLLGYGGEQTRADGIDFLADFEGSEAIWLKMSSNAAIEFNTTHSSNPRKIPMALESMSDGSIDDVSDPQDVNEGGTGSKERKESFPKVHRVSPVTSIVHCTNRSFLGNHVKITLYGSPATAGPKNFDTFLPFGGEKIEKVTVTGIKLFSSQAAVTRHLNLWSKRVMSPIPSS